MSDSLPIKSTKGKSLEVTVLYVTDYLVTVAADPSAPHTDFERRRELVLPRFLFPSEVLVSQTFSIVIVPF